MIGVTCEKRHIWRGWKWQKKNRSPGGERFTLATDTAFAAERIGARTQPRTAIIAHMFENVKHCAEKNAAASARAANGRSAVPLPGAATMRRRRLGRLAANPGGAARQSRVGAAARWNSRALSRSPQRGRRERGGRRGEPNDTAGTKTEERTTDTA